MSHDSSNPQLLGDTTTDFLSNVYAFILAHRATRLARQAKQPDDAQTCPTISGSGNPEPGHRSTSDTPATGE